MERDATTPSSRRGAVPCLNCGRRLDLHVLRVGGTFDSGPDVDYWLCPRRPGSSYRPDPAYTDAWASTAAGQAGELRDAWRAVGRAAWRALREAVGMRR